jgi:Tol biopolymer transport system component
VLLELLMVAVAASAPFIGRLQSPPFRNGAVVYAVEGGENADQLDLFIADQLGGPARPLVVGPDSDSSPASSPQGDRVVFTREGARIMTVSLDGSVVTELASPGTVVRLDWSPDGSTLLASTFSSEDLQALTVVQATARGPGRWTSMASTRLLDHR